MQTISLRQAGRIDEGTITFPVSGIAPAGRVVSITLTDVSGMTSSENEYHLEMEYAPPGPDWFFLIGFGRKGGPMALDRNGDPDTTSGVKLAIPPEANRVRGTLTWSGPSLDIGSIEAVVD